jgi:hypothetical protein
MLLSAKLPHCPISQLENPTTLLGGSSGIMEIVICHLPFARMHPLDYQKKIPPGSNGQLN